MTVDYTDYEFILDQAQKYLTFYSKGLDVKIPSSIKTNEGRKAYKKGMQSASIELLDRFKFFRTMLNRRKDHPTPDEINSSKIPF